MFLDNFELRIEKKNFNLGKTVCQLMSQIDEKMVKLVAKMTFKKSSQKKKKKKCVFI